MLASSTLKCLLKCDIAFRGGQLQTDPDATEDSDYATLWFDETIRVTRGPHTPFYKKPKNLYNTGEAICGGQGCIRACMISLEKRGVLKNSFVKPFRKKKPWKVDWSDLKSESLAKTGRPDAEISH